MSNSPNKPIANHAGVYYPASKEELEKLFTLFNFSLDNAEDAKQRLQLNPRAIIAPHGEYYASGFSANIAHRLLAKQNPKRVVVIGPAQNKSFQGISGSFFNSYNTPLGDLTIDRAYLNVIASNFNITFNDSLHQNEHSTELQMPFIAYYQPQVPVIEFLYNNCDPQLLENLIQWLLEDTLTAVVISSNLSHNVSPQLANALDSITINAIANQNTAILQECEASGLEAISALIKASNTLNLQSHILDYRTTADAIKDLKKVSGFTSAAFTKAL
jgi:AmmeMemoRadiSam system protein B